MQHCLNVVKFIFNLYQNFFQFTTILLRAMRILIVMVSVVGYYLWCISIYVFAYYLMPREFGFYGTSELVYVKKMNMA